MRCHGTGWRVCAAIATAMLCVPAGYLAFTAPDTHHPTLRSTLSLHPDDVARDLERGAAAIRSGQPAEGAAILAPLSDQIDDDARVWNDLCVAHTLLRDYAAAVGECEKALRLAPGFQLAENNLRWAEGERGRATTSVGK